MEEETCISPETLSASSRKLSANIIEDMVNRDQNYDPEKNGYVLFGILTFMTLIREIDRCLLCNSPGTIQHKLQEKMGLCNFFNIRTILTFREIGKGHTAIETFCSLMNMTPPMTVNTYHETIANMHPVYMESAEHSMKAAADEIRKDALGDDHTEEVLVDIDISTDDSWQNEVIRH